MRFSADDCIKYIKQDLKMDLFPHQEYLIRQWFDGKRVYTARAIGRTTCLEAVRSYLAAVLREWGNPYPSTPEVKLDYTHGVVTGLVTQETIDHEKEILQPDLFAKEFLGCY